MKHSFSIPILGIALVSVPALYSPAQVPQAQELRRLQAQKLVERFDELTDSEKQKLAKFGDEAFEALLPLVRKRLARCLAHKGLEPENTSASAALRDVVQVLTPFTRGKHTAILVELYQQAIDEPGAHKVFKDEWLRQKDGNPDLLVPLYLEELKAPGGLDFLAILNYLSHSNHPEALEFLKKSLTDPKADSRIRNAAFANLARTGGADCIPEILAARETSRRIPTLVEYLRLDALPDTPGKPSQSRVELKKTATDAQGRTWGVFLSPVLGQGHDRWVVRRDKGRWVEPIFTGERGISDDWLTRFTEDPTLRVDTDSDGWTDRMEERLGTDPKRADTDGDGLKDSEDANPLVAPRSLNETEKVLAVAFEARYRFLGGEESSPYLVNLPEGVAPLELPSWGWITVSAASNQKSPLAGFTGRGISSISFRSPAPQKTKESILWNADRTSAKLELATYSSSLGATGYVIELKKFGSDWIVIGLEMVWIS